MAGIQEKKIRNGVITRIANPNGGELKVRKQANSQKQIYEVGKNSKTLGFFSKLEDTICGEPKYFLKTKERIERIAISPIYGGKYRDKEYFKVTSPKYGIGYMLAEGLEEVTSNVQRPN